MKALVLHAIGDLRCEDVPLETLRPGSVRIAIRASGICGSDLPRVFTKGTYSFPTIPGHEFAGTIVEAAPDVDPALVGKTAAVFPLLPCRSCPACAVGAYAQCAHYDYFGSRRDGGFAESIVVPVWNLSIAPEGVSFEEAAMSEPAAVALHALRQGRVEVGDVVAILGAGPIGLMLAAWTRMSGAKPLLIDVDPAKIAFAKERGFPDAFDATTGDPVDWVFGVTNGRGADLAIEGSGVSSALMNCLGAARTSGRVVLMGNPAGVMHLSQKAYWDILRKELTVTGTWNSSYAPLPKSDWKAAMDAMASKALDVSPFITHRLPLEKGAEAFAMLRDKSEFSNKVMFVID